MKTLLILISFLFLNDSNGMHQDTPLQIDRNGNITGLPKQFGPAKFDLNKKELRLNNKEAVFPKCLRYYFEEHMEPQLNLSASWYHSKDIMPYYLNFDISDKNVGYTILIDLETLELIYVNKSTSEGNTTYILKVELEEKCLTEYKNEIKTVR
jgi:hypothetical protein